MTSLPELKIYATHPHACSYLAGRKATTLFLDPAAPVDCELYSRLSELGFRRSGPHIYRPHCRGCDACIPARIPVSRFRFDRTQRKLLRRNADISAVECTDIDTDECYALYARYIDQRHSDGDMYPPSREQYRAFLTSQWSVTRFYTFHHNGRLSAVSVVDVLLNGLSAVYTFYESGCGNRSLGNWAILWQIELADRLGLPYLYLGYWIRECRKMAYKGRYRPLEIRRHNRWIELH